MKKSLCILSSSFALVGFASGAGYFTNFDSMTPGDDLAGQDLWQITGGASFEGPSYVGSTPMPFPQTSGTFAGQLGAENATGPSVYVYHDVSVPLVGTFETTTFSVSMIIGDSNFSGPNRDTFGFSLRGAGNTELFSILFTPSNQDAPDSSVRVDNVTWSSMGVESAMIGTLTEGQWTTLDISFIQGSGTDALFSIISAGDALISNVPLAGLSTATIETFGAVMNPVDFSNVGNNVLYFDDISLVPEPSSSLLLCLAGLGFVTRRKRA